MLQFIATTNDRYTVAELVQMAIEGGCKWVILRLPDVEDSEIREMATDLVTLCRETSTILTIENRPELARELAIHGVHLRDYPRPALAVREELGPEAIIGVEVSMASTVMALQNADIDYVTFGPEVSLENLSKNVETLRNAHCEIPVVTEGNYTPETVRTAFEAGANGVAVSTSISDASDPVEATEEIIKRIAPQPPKGGASEE